MAKFYGTIGYVRTYEDEAGIWKSEVTEREYKGDLIKNYLRKDTPSEIHDSINISNEISIVADPYANEHFFEIQYLKFQIPKLAGTWKVTSVDVNNYPRLILSLGGLYNGKQN